VLPILSTSGALLYLLLVPARIINDVEKRTILRKFGVQLGKFIAAELLSGVLPTSWVARGLLLLSYVSLQGLTFYVQHHSKAHHEATDCCSPSSAGSSSSPWLPEHTGSTAMFLRQAAMLLAPPPLRTVASLTSALRGLLHPSLRHQLREMRSALLDLLGGDEASRGSAASSITTALLLGSAALAWRSAAPNIHQEQSTDSRRRGMDQLIAKL